MRRRRLHECGLADLQFAVRILLLEHMVQLPGSVMYLPVNTARTHLALGPGHVDTCIIMVILIFL